MGYISANRMMRKEKTKLPRIVNIRGRDGRRRTVVLKAPLRILWKCNFHNNISFHHNHNLPIWFTISADSAPTLQRTPGWQKEPTGDSRGRFANVPETWDWGARCDFISRRNDSIVGSDTTNVIRTNVFRFPECRSTSLSFGDSGAPYILK